jgi:hypothetical protein
MIHRLGIRNLAFLLYRALILLLIANPFTNCIQLRADEPKSLVQLAQQRFGELTPAEQLLFSSVAENRAATFAVPTAPPGSARAQAEALPQNAGADEGRAISASRLAWLCTDPKAVARINREGIVIVGALIKPDVAGAPINMNNLHIARSLSLKQCVLSTQLSLNQSDISALSITDSILVGGLCAYEIEVSGNLLLSGNLRSERAVRIIYATIGGDLVCRGAEFNSTSADDQDALTIVGTTVKGVVCVDQGCKCNGTLNLYHAQLGLDLVCSGSSFNCSQGVSINAVGVNVKGNILFNREAKRPDSTYTSTRTFESHGKILLGDATVGGDLICSGAKLNDDSANDRVCLDLLGSTVKGTAELGNGFESHGGIRLYNTRIGRDLDCRGGLFNYPGHVSVNAQGIQVDGSVRLISEPLADKKTPRHFVSHGELRFDYARIGGCLSCEGAALDKGEATNGLTLFAPHATIHGPLLLGNRFLSQGCVALPSATIGGIDGTGGAIECPHAMALDLVDATINGSVGLAQFACKGEIRLFGSSIRQDVNCDGAILDDGAEFQHDAKFEHGPKFEHGGEIVLDMERSTVNGALSFKNGFTSHGELRIVSATIGGVECELATFRCPNKTAFDVSYAHVKGAFHLHRGFRCNGSIFARGTTFDQTVDCSGARLSDGDAPALDMTLSTINGSLRLANPFRCGATVILSGSTVSEDVDFSGAKIERGEGIALVMNHMVVKGNVGMVYPFKCIGNIALQDSIIGANVYFDGADISGRYGQVAVQMERISIGGGLGMRGTSGNALHEPPLHEFNCDGTVRLYGATVGGNVEFEAGSFSRASADLSIDMEIIRIGGGLFMSNGFRSGGPVRLEGAKVGKNVECDGGIFTSEGSPADRNPVLNMQRIEVDGSLHLRNKSQCHGTFNLVAAKIGGDLSCSDAEFDGSKGVAIKADGANIGGNVCFCNETSITGSVSLASAVVDRAFHWKNPTLKNAATLDLQSARLGTLYLDLGDDKSSLLSLGLAGLLYNDIASAGPLNAVQTKQWLGRQRRTNEQGKSVAIALQPYSEMASVLRKQGYEDAAREILMERERESARNKSWWGQVGSSMYDKTVRYGYDPWHIWWLVALFVGFGTAAFGLGRWRKLVIEKKPNDPWPPFNALIYSLETLAPVVKLGQQDYFRPDANAGWDLFKIWNVRLTTGGLLQWYLWLHIVVGWAIAAMLVAGLSGLLHTQ